jgi:hypothetical protein
MQYREEVRFLNGIFAGEHRHRGRFTASARGERENSRQLDI